MLARNAALATRKPLHFDATATTETKADAGQTPREKMLQVNAEMSRKAGGK